MKTSHIVLIGSAIGAFVFKDDIKTFFDKNTEKIAKSVKEYAGEKVSITPYKIPKVGFDILKQEIKLSGSILVENKTIANATLETYQIEVILEKEGKVMPLGKTPLLQPYTNLAANAKSKIDYKFRLPLDNLSKVLNDNKDLVNYQMFVLVSNLSVSGFKLPNQKIRIAGKWQEIVRILQNPSKAISNLLNI